MEEADERFLAMKGAIHDFDSSSCTSGKKGTGVERGCEPRPAPRNQSSSLIEALTVTLRSPRASAGGPLLEPEIYPPGVCSSILIRCFTPCLCVLCLPVLQFSACLFFTFGIFCSFLIPLIIKRETILPVLESLPYLSSRTLTMVTIKTCTYKLTAILTTVFYLFNVFMFIPIVYVTLSLSACLLGSSTATITLRCVLCGCVWLCVFVGGCVCSWVGHRGVRDRGLTVYSRARHL